MPTGHHHPISGHHIERALAGCASGIHINVKSNSDFRVGELQRLRVGNVTNMGKAGCAVIRTEPHMAGRVSWQIQRGYATYQRIASFDLFCAPSIGRNRGLANCCHWDSVSSVKVSFAQKV